MAEKVVIQIHLRIVIGSQIKSASGIDGALKNWRMELYLIENLVEMR